MRCPYKLQEVDSKLVLQALTTWGKTRLQILESIFYNSIIFHYYSLTTEEL